MRVAMLGNWPVDIGYGGVAVHNVNLVKNLDNIDGLDLRFISFCNLTDDTKFLEMGKNNILIKTKRIYYFLPPLALLRLALEIKAINPDIIHVQGSNASPYLLFLLFFAPKKCKKMITIHGFIEIENKFKRQIKFSLINLIIEHIEKYALRKIPYIIVCSSFMRDLLSDLTDSEIYVIPNGVNLDTIHEISEAVFVNHPAILFVGRLSMVKGIDLLIKAIPLILESVHDAHFYIIGTGEQETELRELAQMFDVADRIEFLGFISEKMKNAYYQSVDVCVFPSLYEPFGITLLEAMSWGKPVVASNVGGIPSIVKNKITGLTFSVGNIEELADNVILLLKDEKLRNQMGEAGKRRALEFTWDEIAKATNDIYKKVARA